MRQLSFFGAAEPAAGACLAEPPAPSSKPAEGFRFYLGTHHPHWLSQTDVPLFISRRTLAGRKSLPRALGPWALDSAGFTELSLHGRWTISPKAYVAEVRRFSQEIGGLQWAAIQDWMCEPSIRLKTGLSVAEHQRRTTDSWLQLKSLAPELPWVPVLQGWTMGEYLDHAELYDKADPSWRRGLVGAGSVCRRQSTIRAGALLEILAKDGLELHAFGFKRTGLTSSAQHLSSADSLAWSLHARKSPPLPECKGHKSCANCLRFALQWRAETLEALS